METQHRCKGGELRPTGKKPAISRILTAALVIAHPEAPRIAVPQGQTADRCTQSRRNLTGQRLPVGIDIATPHKCTRTLHA